MGPHHAASQQSGTSTEAQLAEGEAQHQEAVRVDETDDEGRHLTGQQGQEAGKLTGCAAFPLNVLNSLDNMGADSRLLYYLIREIKTWLNINQYNSGRKCVKQ